MYILDAILDKKFNSTNRKKLSDERIEFFLNDRSTLVTIEKLTSDTFFCFFNGDVISDFNYILGLDEEIIRNHLFSWFMKKYQIEKLEDMEKIFK